MEAEQKRVPLQEELRVVNTAALAEDLSMRSCAQPSGFRG